MYQHFDVPMQEENEYAAQVTEQQDSSVRF